MDILCLHFTSTYTKPWQVMLRYLSRSISFVHSPKLHAAMPTLPDLQSPRCLLRFRHWALLTVCFWVAIRKAWLAAHCTAVSKHFQAATCHILAYFASFCHAHDAVNATEQADASAWLLAWPYPLTLVWSSPSAGCSWSKRSSDMVIVQTCWLAEFDGSPSCTSPYNNVGLLLPIPIIGQPAYMK